ncbi:MAG: hypothetical protein SFU91_14755 [Chloroherpetonaceae bacterium]|nr:hypothetical protein [Chloroherpetonaceae bacterium]
MILIFSSFIILQAQERKLLVPLWVEPHSTSQFTIESLPSNEEHAIETTEAFKEALWALPISSSPTDSSEVPKRLKLLPANMSLGERALWGESGLFRSLGFAELTPTARKSELEFRRTTLSLHQISGFLTLALFIPTLYFGQSRINDLNRAQTDFSFFPNNNTASIHRAFAMATFASYMTTALLSVLSPPPLIRRDEWSTISTHKLLSWIHFIGMLATPVLIKLSLDATSLEAQKNLRTAHQITAYTTFAALSLSMIVITF